ncbi:MAG: BamA/TamA family outer membrane protein [Prevotellaceae bacterium]|jgi:outer membrane protein assembly factor BamA|nr:BamA/TamA family outer membrane protein [Prevotellaceae bacterium]
MGFTFSWRIYILAVSFTGLCLCSCSTTRKVPEGSYLLKKNTVNIYGDKLDSRALRELSADEIYTYIHQRSNRKDMFKFYLGLYNLSGKNTSKWINRKLQEWGEAPVIFDSTLIRRSVLNIESYMRNRGFYYATVKDSVIVKGKKAEVIYSVNPDASYYIRNIAYDIQDTTVRKYVLSDTLRLRSGRRLSPNMLNRETEAITANLRNKGYYTFNKGVIKFRADSTVGNMQADLTVIIPPFSQMDEKNQRVQTNYPLYKINDVYIYTNYNALTAAVDSTYINTFDTMRYGDMHVLSGGGMNLKPGVLARANLFEKGDYYSEEKVNRTYNNFSGLALFKSITIQFRESKEKNDLLDCLIFLDPIASQSYKVDMELSTNSSDMIGFSPGFSYAHKNLFKGAEVFTLDFRGVFQYSLRSSGNTSQEYNMGASLNLPKFLMPVSLGYFKTQIPHTLFNTSYVYQQRPDYTRAMATIRFGYRWKASQQNTYQLNLLDFNMVKMYDLSPEFYAKINNLYLKNTYSNHFVLGITGSYIYNNQPERPNRWRRSSYLGYIINGDVAGNILSLFNAAMPKDPSLGRMIEGMPYSQYVKADINMIYNTPVYTASELVYRFYFGIGKAYGNSISMPFEKMFYAGGANGLRGWQIRELGPGSVSSDSIGVFPNQVADLRLEFNVEYRFPLFWKFEGAFFADAGNIWSINPSDTRAGAKFGFNRFYKEIAVDTGLGLRLDFDYFVLRFDLGVKVHNPGLPEKSRLIAPFDWLNKNNFNFHFGINYPFNN